MGKRKTGPAREAAQQAEEVVEQPKSKKKRTSGHVSELDLDTLRERAVSLEQDVRQVRKELERLKGQNATLYANTEAKILNNRLRRAETAYADVQRELARRPRAVPGAGSAGSSSLSSGQLLPSQHSAQHLGMGPISDAVAATARLAALAAPGLGGDLGGLVSAALQQAVQPPQLQPPFQQHAAFPGGRPLLPGASALSFGGLPHLG